MDLAVPQSRPRGEEGGKERRDRKERRCTEVWTRVHCLLIDDDDDDGETQGHALIQHGTFC